MPSLTSISFLSTPYGDVYRSSSFYILSVELFFIRVLLLLLFFLFYHKSILVSTKCRGESFKKLKISVTSPWYEYNQHFMKYHCTLSHLRKRYWRNQEHMAYIFLKLCNTDPCHYIFFHNTILKDYVIFFSIHILFNKLFGWGFMLFLLSCYYKNKAVINILVDKTLNTLEAKDFSIFLREIISLPCKTITSKALCSGNLMLFDHLV